MGFDRILNLNSKTDRPTFLVVESMDPELKNGLRSDCSLYQNKFNKLGLSWAKLSTAVAKLC